ncbi:MAG: histidinol-phosphate transaminase [Acidobacteriota bacterium]
MEFDLNTIVRNNIRELRPYSSARSEFSGDGEVWLDANENAFGSPAGDGWNRYPDPLQTQLKIRLAEINKVSPSQVFIGNGSDEAIDLLFRIFCQPGRDEAIICPPTYGMYSVSAAINDVCIREVPLTEEFQLDTDAILAAISEPTKLIFVCSPNNPTGNCLSLDSITAIAESFDGIVAVDEAYIHFASQRSMIDGMGRLKNVVVLQTFSKAWGMAGLRVGMAFADPAIIELLNRVKPPYNVSGIAQGAVLNSLSEMTRVDEWIARCVREREFVASQLKDIQIVETVHPSDANFLLVKFLDAKYVYRYLLDAGIVLRDRTSIRGCEGCLRITIGTTEENRRLLDSLRSI